MRNPENRRNEKGKGGSRHPQRLELVHADIVELSNYIWIIYCLYIYETRPGLASEIQPLSTRNLSDFGPTGATRRPWHSDAEIPTFRSRGLVILDGLIPSCSPATSSDTRPSRIDCGPVSRKEGIVPWFFGRRRFRCHHHCRVAARPRFEVSRNCVVRDDVGAIPTSPW
jgi:hypothetical protein